MSNMQTIEIKRMPPIGETGIVIMWDRGDGVPFCTAHTIEKPETPESVAHTLIGLARRIINESIKGNL